MALNYPSRSVLLSDDCAGKMLGCGCWSEGAASPLSSRGVNSQWWDDLELEETEEECDPVARLPSDPFGMNLEATSATITAAIANCIEDFTARSGGVRPFQTGSSDDFIADLLNYTFVFAPNPWSDGHMGAFEESFWYGGPSGGGDASQYSWLPPDAPCSQPSGFVENPSSSRNDALACCDAVAAASRGFAEDPSGPQDAAFGCCDVVGAAPSRSLENPSSSLDAASLCCDAAPWQKGNDAHPGMFIALGYLGLRDILSVEMVCKSLRSAVRSELYSWKCIHIDSQLGETISDADLLRLTQKSPGVLQCLSLERCKNITDQGLKAVLHSNPQLTKLGIFGNVRITYQGLLDNLRSFNMEASIGIKKLRVPNLVTLTQAQYEELLSLLKIDKGLALRKQEPRIFHADCFFPDHHVGFAPDCFLQDLHDEYTLDIESCPRCGKYKVLYDCPKEGCSNSKSGICRGCLVCIRRCLQCGGCIRSDYVETFNLDSLCLSCLMDGDSHDAEKQNSTGVSLRRLLC